MLLVKFWENPSVSSLNSSRQVPIVASALFILSLTFSTKLLSKVLSEIKWERPRPFPSRRRALSRSAIDPDISSLRESTTSREDFRRSRAGRLVRTAAQTLARGTEPIGALHSYCGMKMEGSDWLVIPLCVVICVMQRSVRRPLAGQARRVLGVG